MKKPVCRKKNAKLPLTVLAALISIVFLIPIFLTISNSFMSQGEITANYSAVFGSGGTEKDENGEIIAQTHYVSETVNLKLIPDMVSFKQYETVLLRSPDYLLKFWNSVFIALPVVLLQVGIASFAAYGFTRYRGKLLEAFFFGYIVLMLMPYQVTLVPNYLVARWLKLLDSRWSIILPGAFAPFSVFILTKNMRRIPKSVFEAAQLDGAGEWKILSQICLPMCKSALVSVSLLVFIDYWNIVEQPLIMFSNAEKYPLSVFLSEINSGEIGIAFAAAVIYLLPMLLLYLGSEEYLEEGISYSGSIKG